MTVDLKLEVWALVCAENAHPYEAPVRSNDLIHLQNEASTFHAALDVLDPWLDEVYSTVEELTPWDPTGFDRGELGAAAIGYALDPAPDGSLYMRGIMPRCPICGSMPSEYGPKNPMEFVHLQVPIGTHVWWDRATSDQRAARITQSIEHTMATSTSFAQMLRPGLAEIEADRYLHEVVEPSIGRDLVLTSRRRFVTKYVFDYNTRAFVDTGNPSDELTDNPPIVIDRYTRTITLADADIPIEEQVEGPEYDFYRRTKLKAQT